MVSQIQLGDIAVDVVLKDTVLIRFYVAMRPGHTGLASAVCIASKRPPSASI